VYFKGFHFNHERRWMWASLGHKVILHQFSFIKQYPILLIYNYSQTGDETGGCKVKLGPKDRMTLWMSLLHQKFNTHAHRFQNKTSKQDCVNHSLTYLFTLLIFDDLLVFLVMLHLLWTSLLTMSNLGTKLKFTRIRAHTHTDTQTRQASSTAHRILWAVN